MLRAFVGGLLAALVASPILAAELSVGDPAPDFLLVGAGGIEYRTADFKNTRAYVLPGFRWPSPEAERRNSSRCVTAERPSRTTTSRSSW